MLNNKFFETLRSHNIPTPSKEVIEGVFLRWGENLGDTKYWAIRKRLIEQEIITFGDWSTGFSETVYEKDWKALSSDDRKSFNEQRTKLREEEEASRNQLYEDAAVKALKKWTNCSSEGESVYLDQKHIKSHNIRFEDGKIIIPIYDTSYKIWSLQSIDKDKNKRFFPSGKLSGNFFVVNKTGKLQDGDKTFLAEGYATAASIYEATGKSVIVSFTANNLEKVYLNILEQYPNMDIIIAADNDHTKEKNTGLEVAKDLNKKYQLSYVYPIFSDGENGSDFNDIHVNLGLDEVRKQLKKQQIDFWVRPKPMEKSLLPVQEFPLDLLPSPLKQWVADVAFRMQCPRDYVAIPILVVISSLIGTKLKIKPKKLDDWSTTPNLWGCIIGSPSTLKSPASKEALKMLSALEKIYSKKYSEEMKTYEIELEVYKIAKNNFIASSKKNKSIDQVELCSQLQAIEEPKKPVLKRLKSNDVTVEKLFEILSENPQGILVCRDELLGLLLSFNKAGHEGDRAFYLEAWDCIGDSYTYDRIGRGTIQASNTCVSVFGSTQPDKIISYLSKAISGLDNDGLIQRFQLMVYPDHDKPWQYVDMTPNEDAASKVFNLIKAIDALELNKQSDDEQSENRSKLICFDDKAQEIFEKWLTDLEHKIRKDGEENIIVEHLSKYRKLMPALSLILQVIESLNQPDASLGRINVDNTLKAAAWCDYLETHARRIYGLVLNGDNYARALLENIENGTLCSPFTVYDVRRKEWKLLTEKENIITACEILEEKGYLKREIIEPAQRQKGTTQFYINPLVGVRQND